MTELQELMEQDRLSGGEMIPLDDAPPQEAERSPTDILQHQYERQKAGGPGVDVLDAGRDARRAGRSASDAVREAAARANAGRDPASMPRHDFPEYNKNMGRVSRFMEGPMMGGFNEAAGGMVGVTHGAEAGEAVDQYMQDQDAMIQEMDPDASFNANAAGIAASVPIYAVAPGAAPGATAKSLGGVVARTGLWGLAYGGAGGALSAQGNWKNRGRSALIGAAIGGPLAAAVPSGAAVIKSGFAGVKGLGKKLATLGDDFSRLEYNDKTALAMVYKAFLDDGIPIDDAMRAVDDWAAAGGTPQVLADAGGKNVQDMLHWATTTSESGGARVVKNLNQRHSGQVLRAREALRAAGITDADGAIGQYVATQAKRKADAGVNYGVFEQEPVLVSDEISAVLNNPLMKPLIDSVTEGRPAVSNTHLLRIKRAADKAANRLFADGNGGAGEEMAVLAGRLDDQLASLSPAYEKARNTYASDSAILGAFEFGGDALSWSADIAENWLAGKTAHARAAATLNGVSAAKQRRYLLRNSVTDGEKEAFRVGLAYSLEQALQKVGTSPDGTTGRSIYQAIFNDERKRRVVEQMFPNQAAYKRFERLMQREANAVDLRYKIAGGSQTSPRQAIDARVESDMRSPLGDFAMEALRVSPAGMLQTMGRGARNARLGRRKKELGEAITQHLAPSFDPDASRRSLRLMQHGARGGRMNEVGPGTRTMQWPKNVGLGAAHANQLSRTEDR